MLAFPIEPGVYALRAFEPSKSGKSWYRTCFTRAAAIACKRELVAAGIRYTCKKVDKPAGPQRRKKPFKPLREPRSRGLSPRSQLISNQEFEQYRRQMAVPKPASQPLPEPRGAPGIDRRPGLSKSAPKEHRNRSL